MYVYVWVYVCMYGCQLKKKKTVSKLSVSQ